jgi:hypothetical protein
MPESNGFLRDVLPTSPAPRGRSAARFDFVLDRGKDAHLFSRDRVERWPSEQGGARFLVYCADYGPGAGMGAANAPGAPKFAEILVRKKLEERGELTPDKQLLVYETRKTRSGEIRVVYQIAPTARVSQALRAVTAQPAGAFRLDALSLLQGLLHGLARRGSNGQTRALALALEDSITLAVGGRELLFARRYPRLSNDEHSLAEVVTLLRQDLAALAPGAPVDEALWIEPLRARPLSQEELQALGAGQGPRIAVAPLVEMRMGYGRCWSALPPLLPRLWLGAAQGGRAERWLWPLERWEPALWLALAAGTLLLLGLAWSWARQGDAAQAETERLRAEFAATEGRLPPLPAPVDPTRVEETFRLSELLRRASAAPPLGAVWSALAEAKPEGLELLSLSLDYPAPPEEGAAVDVALLARLSEGLLNAQTVARAFVDGLERQGFTVLERSLALDNERENHFSLRLRYARPERP